MAGFEEAILCSDGSTRWPRDNLQLRKATDCHLYTRWKCGLRTCPACIQLQNAGRCRPSGRNLLLSLGLICGRRFAAAWQMWVARLRPGFVSSSAKSRASRRTTCVQTIPDSAGLVTFVFPRIQSIRYAQQLQTANPIDLVVSGRGKLSRNVILDISCELLILQRPLRIRRYHPVVRLPPPPPNLRTDRLTREL